MAYDWGGNKCEDFAISRIDGRRDAAAKSLAAGLIAKTGARGRLMVPAAPIAVSRGRVFARAKENAK